MDKLFSSRIIYKLRQSDRRNGFLLRGKCLSYSAALKKQKFYTRQIVLDQACTAIARHRLQHWPELVRLV